MSHVQSSITVPHTYKLTVMQGSNQPWSMKHCCIWTKPVNNKKGSKPKIGWHGPERDELKSKLNEAETKSPADHDKQPPIVVDKVDPQYRGKASHKHGWSSGQKGWDLLGSGGHEHPPRAGFQDHWQGSPGFQIPWQCRIRQQCRIHRNNCRSEHTWRRKPPLEHQKGPRF